MTLLCRLEAKGSNAENREGEQISAKMIILKDSWRSFTDKNESRCTVETGDNCTIQFIYKNGGGSLDVVFSGNPTEVA